MDELYQMLVVTLTAMFGFVVLKMVFGRYYVPGVSDFVASA